MNRKPSARTWSVVGLLFAANIIAYVDRSNLSVALASPDFKNYFALTDAQRGDLSSAFFWTYAFLQIPAGAVADRWGVKIPLAAGLLMWSLVSAATGLSELVWHIFIFRCLLGIGEAIITPAALKWIRANVPEERRGMAVGIFFAGAKLGPAVGTRAAVWLLAAFGWREMFVILGLGCALWVIPWWFIAENDRTTASDPVSAGASALPFGSVFRTPAIYGIIIGTFAYNYFNYFCMTWLPAYFVEHWKLSLPDMGWYTAFSFGGMATVAIVAGAIADRMIARGADTVKVRKGFTIAGLAVASTEILGVMSGSREMALAFAIISLSGLGLATANYWALTQTLMPGAAIGKIAGVQNFASNLSGIVAPIVTGRLVALTGSYEAPMQAVLILLACGIAAYVFLVRPEYAPKQQASQKATIIP